MRRSLVLRLRSRVLALIGCRPWRPGLVALLGPVVALSVASCGLIGGDASPSTIMAESDATPTTPPESTPLTTLPATTATPSTTAPLPVVVADVAALADRTAMTDEGRRVFYEADPQLVDKTQLTTACTLSEEVSVLGCFGPEGIAVLVISDRRLDGMMETTAAHEMLHAAWVQLTGPEREQLTAQVQAAYGQIDDPGLQEKVELYRQSDPAVVDTELHSILGTEVAVLPAELEAYYTRWFTDRQAVVTLASTAQATLDDLEAQVEALDAELAGLQPLINDEQARLDTENDSLSTLTAELDQLRTNGQIDEYNAAIPGFNERVDAYNADVDAFQTQVDDYNALVAERNLLAEEWDDLREPIDTSIPSLMPDA